MNRVATWLAGIFALTGAGAAETPATPLTDGYMRTGVPSCSTAGCHGDQVSGAGAGSVVGQNEYLKWRSPRQMGAHSRAYDALLTPLGRRIARNLGIDAAHEAPQCLSCHGDNVPHALRSARFQLSDGVGCEACHGGAQNWLAFHRIGAGHAKNVEAGLYPTDDPLARGQLCLSCHMGSTIEYQFVSHQLMGAGHPRLKFELDLYTTIQKHHTVDDDYRMRKQVAPGAKFWAIGQALSLQRMLELLTDEQIGRKGAFPEFVFYDCHACHQPISGGAKDLSWRPNPARALGPGVPILNDANYIMLLAAMRVLDPVLAQRIERDGMTLHMASQNNRASLHMAAMTLHEAAEEATAQILAADFSKPATVAAIFREIIDVSTTGRYTNYAAAEQALFAVQRLADDLGVRSPAMKDAIAEASRHAQSPYTYDQSEFRHALQRIGGLIAQ